MNALLEFVKPPIERDSIRALAHEIEVDFVYVSTYLNWFSAQLMSELGAEEGLTWLIDNSSKRVSFGDLEDAFVSDKFRRLVYQNTSQGNIEIQSLTGLQESMRRYLIGFLLRDGCPQQEIATTLGTSLRTVQRHSAAYKSHVDSMG